MSGALRAAAEEVVAEWTQTIADGGLVTIALAEPIDALRAALAASEGQPNEKERLAQALRDGDMDTFTEATRKANVHRCCSGCDAKGHCTHGYER